MKTIKVKCPLGYLEFTEDELENLINDFDFLMDAFLVLLNEDVCSKSDIPFNKKQILKYAKDMYLESNYSDEFIKECFKK